MTHPRDPKALNKRLYKEVTEAQLTAVLIITVRNCLGWEMNDIVLVETRKRFKRCIHRHCDFHWTLVGKSRTRVKCADLVICNALRLSLILKLK